MYNDCSLSGNEPNIFSDRNYPKLNCIWYKVRGDVNAVVLFIFVYKTAEDTAGLVLIRLIYLHFLKASLHS